jgi:hypothetical protein
MKPNSSIVRNEKWAHDICVHHKCIHGSLFTLLYIFQIILDNINLVKVKTIRPKHKKNKFKFKHITFWK